MPSSHLILGHPLLLLPPMPPSIRVFSYESTLHMRWPKYWSFSWSIIPSKEIPRLISFKVGLKFNIQKTKIIASGPITSWEIDGKRVEIVSVFISGGFKITADSDCSHEIKRHLLLRRKTVASVGCIIKSRDITLPTKSPILCHQRIDAFELWCWRRLLRVPWTARRYNQFILKEISPGISL